MAKDQIIHIRATKQDVARLAFVADVRQTTKSEALRQLIRNEAVKVGQQPAQQQGGGQDGT